MILFVVHMLAGCSHVAGAALPESCAVIYPISYMLAGWPYVYMQHCIALGIQAGEAKYLQNCAVSLRYLSKGGCLLQSKTDPVGDCSVLSWMAG